MGDTKPTRHAGRRAALGTLIMMTAAASGAADSPGSNAPPIRLRSRDVFLDARSGVCVRAESFYTTRDGREKMRYRAEQTQSDKNDALEVSRSEDNGRTWSAPESLWVLRRAAEGTVRRGFKSGWVDPVTGHLLVMCGQGLWPADKPTDPNNRGNLMYMVSTNGGRSFTDPRPVIQRGEYDLDHPMEGVWGGRNSASYGDRVGRPIRTRRGHILQPIQISPVGDDGERYNPLGSFTYMESAVLIGTWTNGCEIDWELSQRVANQPAVSSRGAFEPTVAELPDGRIMMVMRGSNQGLKNSPGYKWCSMSADGGLSWSPIRPWTYDDGTHFYSPSSCSQLIPHSSGRIYWIGNIVPRNPTGNSPRYPLVAALVDPQTGQLVKESVTPLDDRAASEPVPIMLSNFVAHEDRETGDILLHMSRPFSRAAGDWTSPAYLCRIAVAP